MRDACDPGRPIEIVYTDLPRNDFSQLFRTIHGQTELRATTARSRSALSRSLPGPRSTKAIFPRDSLDLAFSATASHYISKVPGTISDHVHMVGRARRGAARL